MKESKNCDHSWKMMLMMDSGIPSPFHKICSKCGEKWIHPDLANKEPYEDKLRKEP